MTRIGLVNPSAISLGANPETPASLSLQMQEGLASRTRLWLRGQVTGIPEPAVTHSRKEGHWWSRRPPEPISQTRVDPAILETRIGARLLSCEVNLGPRGRFNATFTTDLPATKRGWRMALNRVICGDLSAEKCTLVVHPREQVRMAVIVALPSGSRSHEAFDRLTPVLRELKGPSAGEFAYYYLACEPGGNVSRPSELALSMTSHGWPSGTCVMLEADEENSSDELLSDGVERLRWLFAGALDTIVVSGDGALNDRLHQALQPKAELAKVVQFVNAEQQPGLNGRSSASSLWSGMSEPVTRPTRAARIPRYPVVFCHGMLASSTLYMRLPDDLNCFSSLRHFLRERGFRALFPQVEPTGGVASRAAQLREQIRNWTDEPVNVIAHSMGGLDARYMITHLDMAEQVRSLITIATPHRGTYLVEWFLANYRTRVPILRAFEAAGISLDGFHDCQRGACREFNAATPDMPQVKYFSYGGSVPSSHVTPPLRRAWSLLHSTEGPNDGMVSEASAHWGEYLGTVHADHFAQTPDMLFVRPGEDFDAPGFYCRVLEDLARRGF